MPSPSLGAGKLKVDNAWSQHQGAAGSQPSGAIALDPPVMKEYDRRLTLKGVGSGWAFGRLFGGADASNIDLGYDGAFPGLIRLERKM